MGLFLSEKEDLNVCKSEIEKTRTVGAFSLICPLYWANGRIVEILVFDDIDIDWKDDRTICLTW